MLADVARQADASQRRGAGEARVDDVERPRAAGPPSRAAARDAERGRASPPRRCREAEQAGRDGAARRAEAPKTRTALVAAPRSERRAPAARSAAHPRRSAAPVDRTAPMPRPCSRRRPIALNSPAPRRRRRAPRSRSRATPPIRCWRRSRRRSGRGAARACRRRPGAGADRSCSRPRSARMRGESQATQQTVAALQARVREAEEARYRNVLVYVLAAATLLGVARRRAPLVAAAAPAPPGALVRGAGQPAGARRGARRPVDLGRPRLAAGAAVAADGADAGVRQGADAASAAHATPLRGLASSGWSSGSGRPDADDAAVVDRRPRGDHGARPRALAPVGRAVRPWRRRALRHGGELTMEELIDLEQQAEFFVVLGQDEAAMTLLESYIDGERQEPAALPAAARDPPATRRSRRLRRSAPQLRRALRRQRARLEREPAARPRPRGLPADGGAAAVALVDAALGDAGARRAAVPPRGDRGDLRPSRPTASCCSSTRSRARSPRTSRPTSARSTCSCRSRTPPSIRSPRIRSTRPLEVDLDVSQWPEDAAMSDLLSRPKPSGRRGAA